MTSFALVRPSLDTQQNPITVLICERPTLPEAEAMAQKYLRAWPDLRVEKWTDSDYTLQPDGSKKWRKHQGTEVVRTFQEAT